MANIIRSAKSGNDWGLYELYAFNIEIVSKTADEFFDHRPLPPQQQLDVSSVILDNLDEPADAPREASDFFKYLEDAIAIRPNEEPFVGDFAQCVLKLMRYDTGRRIVPARSR
jgi:hypothetical protein